MARTQTNAVQQLIIKLIIKHANNKTKQTKLHCNNCHVLKDVEESCHNWTDPPLCRTVRYCSCSENTESRWRQTMSYCTHFRKRPATWWNTSMTVNLNTFTDLRGLRMYISLIPLLRYFLTVHPFSCQYTAIWNILSCTVFYLLMFSKTSVLFEVFIQYKTQGNIKNQACMATAFLFDFTGIYLGVDICLQSSVHLHMYVLFKKKLNWRHNDKLLSFLMLQIT